MTDRPAAQKWLGLLAAAFCLMTTAAAHAAPKKPAPPPKKPAGEIARSIAYLMRVADNACPGVTYDPAAMVKLADPRSSTVLQIRAKFRDDFQKSYDEAGARVAAEGVGAYCDVVIKSFATKPREFPGLKIK